MSESASLKEAFNGMTVQLQKSAVLQIHNGIAPVFYDFAQRVVMTQTTGGYYNSAPFSQIDREVLVAARDKLIELGGTPPELPAEAPTAVPKLRSLNP